MQLKLKKSIYFITHELWVNVYARGSPGPSDYLRRVWLTRSGQPMVATPDTYGTLEASEIILLVMNLW